MKIDFSKFNAGNIEDFLRLLHPCVEANRESLLIQLLACFGNCIGRTAFFTAAEDKHYTNLFVVVVGKSSRGRKGQSLNLIRSLFKGVDDIWYADRIKKGLSSGEGLIKHIEDKVDEHALTGVKFNQGNLDKRILCLESEFSSVLRMTQREGNILSQILRDAWDGSDLQTLTKNDPLRAKEPMVSIIGHITDTELTKLLSSNEIANGLANRFIFIRGYADKCLPNPEPLSAESKLHLSNLLNAAVSKARQTDLVEFEATALPIWNEYYTSISHDDISIVGSLSARQEAQVRRLAMIITLINGKCKIDKDALAFARSIYQYSLETLREIYGYSFGDLFTDRILDYLKSSPDGKSKSEIWQLFSKNNQKGSLDRSLKLLQSQQLIDCVKIETAGRPVEIWKYVEL